MSINVLLSRLEGVKRTGKNRWVARCPAHEDRSPSLALTETADGFPLWHCFAACDQLAVLSAVGLGYAELLPASRPSEDSVRVRRPYQPMDVLRCAANEALLVSIIASDMAKGEPLTEEVRTRLWKASTRLQKAVEVAEDE